MDYHCTECLKPCQAVETLLRMRDWEVRSDCCLAPVAWRLPEDDLTDDDEEYAVDLDYGGEG